MEDGVFPITSVSLVQGRQKLVRIFSHYYFDGCLLTHVKSVVFIEFLEDKCSSWNKCQNIMSFMVVSVERIQGLKCRSDSPGRGSSRLLGDMLIAKSLHFTVLLVYCMNTHSTSTAVSLGYPRTIPLLLTPFYLQGTNLFISRCYQCT